MSNRPVISFDASANVATSDADIIVNTVNTVGVMGAGVALAVKKRFPEVMPLYTERCRTRDLYPGSVQAIKIEDGPTIVNLASKDHFKDPSKPEWVGLGLVNLNRLLALPKFSGVKTVLLPPPGAGLGGLSPEVVQRMIRSYISGPHESIINVTVSAPEVTLKPREIIYAGIGSRETPREICLMMTEVAQGLAAMEWRLRSGNAIGADIAFEKGAPIALTESYLPWAKKEVPHGIVAITPEHDRLMKSVYRSPFGQPWSPSMSRSTHMLMTRNGNQIFGPDFTEPSDLVICYTPGGEEKGGTRQAIALAKLVNIPVLNLGLPEWQNANADAVIREALRLVEERRADIGVPILSKNDHGPVYS